MVAVVESMKLETALHAPVAGRVAEVLVDVNTQVESSTKLVRIEPDPDQDEAGEPESGSRADLARWASVAAVDRDLAATAADALAALRSLVLGYDIDEPDTAQVLERLAAARADLPADDPRLLAGEIAILQHLRRPVRAVAQPAGARRGRIRRGSRRRRRSGPQPAGVLLRLPALPRRRHRGAARVVPDQAAAGAGALRRARPGAVTRPGACPVPDVPRPPPRGRARAGRL